VVDGVTIPTNLSGDTAIAIAAPMTTVYGTNLNFQASVRVFHLRVLEVVIEGASSQACGLQQRRERVFLPQSKD
jgi:hypothetical protein